jgi:hypothetical protein
MSCWWDIDFTVTGPELAGAQDQFTEKTMSEMRFEGGAKLFHYVQIVAGVPGYRVIHASRNYYGGSTIEELIARFPNLTFIGSLHSDNTYERYTLFEGRGGKATFTEHEIPDFDQWMKPEVPEQLGEADQEIGSKGCATLAERAGLTGELQRERLSESRECG